MKNTGTFIKTILPADGNNIVKIIDFNEILAPYRFLIEAGLTIEHAIVLEDFQAKVGLFSLLKAGWPDANAISTDAQIEAELTKIKEEGQKIYLGCYHAYGNGNDVWEPKGEEVLQNKNGFEQPWTLMAPYFSTNTTALIDEDLKIGLRIEPKAEGVGGLKGNDYIRIFGAWKKVTNKENLQMLLNPNANLLNSTNSPASSSGAIANNVGTIPTLVLPDRSVAKNRKDLFFYNAGPDSVLINYGTTVSPTTYTAEILPTGSWRDFANSQGPISARAKNNVATLNVTEFITLI